MVCDFSPFSGLGLVCKQFSRLQHHAVCIKRGHATMDWWRRNQKLMCGAVSQSRILSLTLWDVALFSSQRT